MIVAEGAAPQAAGQVKGELMEMNPPRHRTLLALACLLASLCPGSIRACECHWIGPFLTVAPDAELIVCGRVLSYHDVGKISRIPQAMDVQVLEVLKGRTSSSRLRVWGDDGHLCRPYVTQFPVGTEWVLALGGPGSKPAMSPGPAISVCGEYWLRVKGDRVVGNIRDTANQQVSEEMPLAELRHRLGVSSSATPAPGRRSRMVLRGEVRAGQAFERAFGSGLVFRLEPQPLGWQIVVREAGRDEDLSRLTPPFHSVPNPRDIEGWHFRNADNTGPNEPGEKNVNAPGQTREFIFSPEVGRTIQGPDAKSGPSPEEIDAVRGFGEGTLEILDYRLRGLEPAAQAALEWMRFEVRLAWR
jgi:hypothetical protein